MARWQVTAVETRLVEVVWEVEAESEEAALAAFDAGRRLLVCEDAKEVTDSEVVDVEPVEPDDTR